MPPELQGSARASVGDLRGEREAAMEMQGEVVQAQGTACAKALGRGGAWCVGGRSGGPPPPVPGAEEERAGRGQMVLRTLRPGRWEPLRAVG